MTRGLKLRGEIKLPKCAVAGCNEVPSERLQRIPELVWCKPHGALVSCRIAERDYSDVCSKLRESGLKAELILFDDVTPTEKRRCCVSRCQQGVNTVYTFEPFRVPGRAGFCASHSFALNYATQRMNPQRIVAGMEQARKAKKLDRYTEKRKKVILALCVKYSSHPNYTEQICAELQKKRIWLLDNWRQEWNRQHSLGLQKWDWKVAYDAKVRAIRQTIQNHISAVCNPRVRKKPAVNA